VQRALLSMMTGASVPVVTAIGRSLRWKTDGLEHLRFDDGRRPIMVFWHGRIMTATYFFRRRGIVVMISENFSGEWIARVITRFGYGTSRGSTADGGSRALLQLARDVARGKPAGFAVDGPSGPACRVQPGALWLAKVTGNPIVPFHMEASRFWCLDTWDRTQIPKPFSTVALVVGAPLDVPADASRESLEAKRLELEGALRDLEPRARAYLR
jgi:lysophospholipid acyltransferase (LPLAT)-like uncharacterized protein